MSRRKQAKPRAVLKHDNEGEKQHDLCLSEDKTEFNTELECTHQTYILNGKINSTIENIAEGSNDKENGKSKENDNVNEKQHPTDETEEVVSQKKFEIRPLSAEICEINDINNDEDDNTSDSFYSDLYSTQTTSSYSASMSEEAETPNFLEHHLQKGEDRNEDTEVNLNEGRVKIVPQHNHGDNKQATDELGVNVVKIPTKIRKIDRNLMKLEKITSDDIKTTSDGSYQCQFCEKSFPRLGYLKKHEQSHAEHLPFKCDYCARLFKHKRSRDRHTKLHTGDRRYRCPHCEAAFSRSDHLKIHMKTHDNQKPFQCTVCNRGYNTAAALTSHMQNHKKQSGLLSTGQSHCYSPRSTGSGSSNGSLYKRKYNGIIPNKVDYRKQQKSSLLSCMYCTKSDFSSIEQLNSHVQAMHEHFLNETSQLQTDETIFQLCCEYCTMKFPNITAMFQHMRTTHMDRLASPNSYFEHFNRLAASGTFSPRLITSSRCEDIKIKVEASSPRGEVQRETEKEEEQVGPTDLSQPKRRTQSPSLSDSMGKLGNFLCNQCNAGFPDFDTFRSHLKTHITQAITNLVCHHCGLSLRDQTEYDHHILSHFLIASSEYSCEAPCNKVFTKPDDLQKHLFDDHVQIMYKCSHCSDLFDTKVAIQVHFACTHSNENKVLKCSSCMESFRNEKDFSIHVKSRHTTNGSIQCMFCRAICTSELEMHFHLAGHARQFRCPSCPETFHVEFLLDRHMQTHHTQKELNSSASSSTLVNPLYHSQFNKHMPITNNNKNPILDYHVLAAGKNLFPIPGGGKYYNPLQIDTSSISNSKHATLMYGYGQSYFDANKNVLDMYNYHQENKTNSYFVNPNNYDSNRGNNAEESKSTERAHNGLSCGICERVDFRSETEVLSHRKIVHNLKTGVSLKCAYCNGNFKSRTELEHHMKTCHNSTGRHKCLICDEIFPSPAILAEHKLRHSKVGQSGKCSHCSATINDVTAFKTHLSEHNTEGQIPVQCICCRQTLNSDFEVGLHAKFHTKSSSSPENVCALCLEILPSTMDTRVCEKCCRNHNLNSKFNIPNDTNRMYVENRCNLCKEILPHAQRLQEHLVEHTFIGCEERGYSCYICSAVFTVPAGLLSHMLEHGLNARPYDCNICTEKYFFRAELENHLIQHKNDGVVKDGTKKNEMENLKNKLIINAPNKLQTQVKIESVEENDDEYIEVEKIADQTENPIKSQDD